MRRTPAVVTPGRTETDAESGRRADTVLTDSIDAADYQAVAKAAGKEPKVKREFAQWLDLSGTGPWEREHRFHPTRRWRWDWANVELKLALEYDGVMNRNQPGHLSTAGQMRDSEKTNEAILLGWTVIRVNAKTIGTGDAHRWVEQAWMMRMEAAG